MIPAWLLAVMYFLVAAQVLANIRIEPSLRAGRLMLAVALVAWGAFFWWTQVNPLEPLHGGTLPARVLLTRWLHFPLLAGMALLAWGRWYRSKRVK